MGAASPPPRHNFVTIPPIRSDSPAFDLHYPGLRGSSRGNPLQETINESEDGAPAAERGAEPAQNEKEGP